MNLLVVEDDPTDLKLMRAILTAEGHKVAAARTAEHALQILARSLPHIILTDLALPEMDGIEFTKRLKASPETVKIPVIATTAFSDRFPKREAERAAGFAAYLVKPIDPLTLPALLIAVCGRT